MHDALTSNIDLVCAGTHSIASLIISPHLLAKLMTVDYEEESKGIIIGQPTCTIPLFCSYRLVVLQCVVIVVT